MANDLQLVLEKLGELYLPTPRVALDQRPRRSFELISHQRVLPVDTALRANVFESPGLDVKGFTLQNAFLNIQIERDVLVAGGAADPDNLVLSAVLEGSCGSGWVQLANAGLTVAYTGPGAYEFGLLANDQSLSTEIRCRILGQALEADRVITYTVTGTLVAGAGF